MAGRQEGRLGLEHKLLGGDVSVDEAAFTEGPESDTSHRARRRFWQRASPRSATPKTVGGTHSISMAPKVAEDEPWAWSIGVSDWPIGKTDYDLPAEKALEAVVGLDRYYEHAMATLARAGGEDD